MLQLVLHCRYHFLHKASLEMRASTQAWDVKVAEVFAGLDGLPELGAALAAEAAVPGVGRHILHGCLV